jgi:hypothetical protein
MLIIILKTGWLTPVIKKNEKESEWSNEQCQGGSLGDKIA